MTRRAGYSQPAAAHPRVCGENLVVRLRNAFAVGSSPRVRGKPHARGDRTRVRRLIPARAGKIRRASSRGWARRAHPRACGENRHLQHGRVVSHGSSPRVRGKRRTPRSPHPVGGLIPARAGKTRGRRWSCSDPPAHPRACGENPQVLPPRQGGRRLIPARAGKTPRAPWRPSRRWAHPRACGENSEGALAAVTTMGSSPRVRGKQVRHRPPRRRRLIPACAGKTLRLMHLHSGVPAHPRVCGENPAAHAFAFWGSGSSPRVRGKPLDSMSPRRRTRLIPARAGKTHRSNGGSLRPRAHPRACGENAVRRATMTVW